MKLGNTKSDNLFNNVTVSIIVLSLISGLIYWLADIYVDRAFADDTYMREIFEKASVIALFCFFGGVIIFLLKKMLFYQFSLTEQEKKYHEYINCSPDPIFVTAKDGKIIETNPAMEKMTGLNMQSLKLKSLPELMAPDSIQTCYSFLTQIGETGSAEGSLKLMSENRIIYVAVNAVRMADTRIIMTAHDITDYIEVSNNYKKLNQDLNEQVQSELRKVHLHEQALENSKKFTDMGNMLTAISHHWRQPLNALGLQVQDMVDSYHTGDINDEYMREFNEVTTTLINDMSGTIDKFRHFFSFSSTETEINVVNEILDVLNILSAQIYYLGVDVHFSCGCEKQNYDCKNFFSCPDCKFKSALTRGDVGNFHHAVLNIIYNSLDSIAETKRIHSEMKGQVRVKVRCDDKHIFVDVEDNGLGFSDEVLKHAFEPYYSTKDEGKGAGIGLFMVKMVIDEQMGGEVMIGNTDSGANVHIILPKLAS